MIRKFGAVVLCLVALSSCAGDEGARPPFFDAEDPSLYCNNFDRPAREVLDQVSGMFDCTIDATQVPKTRKIGFADFKIHPWSLESTMHALLESYDMSETDGGLKVIALSHHKLSPEDGGAMMEWLAGKYGDREQWEARKAAIRAGLKANMGIDKVPDNFEGKVFLSEPRAYDGYSVRNLGLEILPGVYCTANVYAPTSHGEKMPLVLNPNGHYEGGRFHNYIQTRCAMFAQMGCVAVSYDMFAYGHEVMFNEKYHRTALAQPYNMLCADRLLDYFLAGGEIDTSKVAITGSSGGGSQCFFFTALDDRITLSMPVVMVSSASFGGCTCESGTRVHFSGGLTNNVELAALCAPRPMLLVSDGADWTARFPDIDFPYVKRIYSFYGAEDRVGSVHFADEVHDYGESKRQAVYAFLARQWGMDLTPMLTSDGRVDESKCVIEDEDALKVWGKDYRDMPGNAIHTPGEFAKLIGWER